MGQFEWVRVRVGGRCLHAFVIAIIIVVTVKTPLYIDFSILYLFCMH